MSSDLEEFKEFLAFLDEEIDFFIYSDKDEKFAKWLEDEGQSKHVRNFNSQPFA